MPAPRQPIEIREFPRPDLPSGAALLRTLRSEVCGTDVHLWHGRLAGVPYPIIPGHVSAGVLEVDSRAAQGARWRDASRRRSRRLLRRASDVRAVPCLHRSSARRRAVRPGASTASPTRRARACSAAGRSTSISSLASASRDFPTRVSVDDYIGGGCGLLTAVHIRERAALRPGDSVLVQGVGAVGLCAIALCRLAGASTIFAVGDPASRLVLARADGRRPRVRARVDVGRRTPAGRPRPDERRGRRRRDRGRRFGARRRGRRDARPRRRPLRHCRALH